MARTKNAHRIPICKWNAQRYRDHENQPAIMIVYSPTNPEALIGPLPLIAIQIYTTVPLDSDSDHELITLCHYLASGIDHGPNVSFEIYATPQPDIFACVEHQRREIFIERTISRQMVSSLASLKWL
ncbi:uncharacterized protein N7484_003923 [Penicillium longicatenatum]|uniref:uncharacterized protein n=1 Tax=Penicillium longicatenatum TaxID=1561947 RepID=UPI002548AE24|nr:uncharacterized protein N7484_003923 [Penicillium longicatenatum]KAJ5650200.1 hypothetical protein N7484_003923 [Penicillium longicatenatum]